MQADPLRHFTWHRALLLLAGVLVFRLVYQLCLSPWELVGDEAYYWLQGRHLELGSSEKGPLLPWLIAASCHLFGDTAFAVRLPIVLAFGLSAWGIGRLAIALTNDERAGFLSVAIFCLVPAFQANAQLATQDGPLITLWVALTAVGLRLFRRWRVGLGTWTEWLLVWVLLGVGVLLKHTVLLFIPSLVLYAFLKRRSLVWRMATLFAQQVAGAAVFLACVSPLLMWNARRGWPMLAHTAGHLGAGGDQAGHVPAGHPILWLLAVVGAIVGACGPAFFLLLRPRGGAVPESSWLLCAAAPGVLFFVLLSLTKPVIGSWPLPAMVSLVPLAAQSVVRGLSLEPVDARVRRTFGALVIYGVLAQFLFFFPTPLSRLPFFGERLERGVIRRFTGRREKAISLSRVLASLDRPDSRRPLLVADHYMEAALLTFYLPGHPSVSCAGMGRRSTTFDLWPDTRLDDPSLLGRSLVLIGPPEVGFDRGLRFGATRRIADGVLLAEGFRGPRLP